MTVNVTITTTADPAHFEQWDSPTPGGTLTLQGAFAIGAPAAQVAYATQLREIRVAATELLPPPYSKNPPPPPPNPAASPARNDPSPGSPPAGRHSAGHEVSPDQTAAAPGRRKRKCHIPRSRADGWQNRKVLAPRADVPVRGQSQRVWCQRSHPPALLPDPPRSGGRRGSAP